MPFIIYSAEELLSLRPMSPAVLKVERLKISRELVALLTRRHNGASSSVKHTSNETSSDSEEQLLHKGHVNRSEGANGDWQYHGRFVPELNVEGPIPAPSGLKSQKDEGFQRFYKAVVSPTHIRVTAGGKIVPNTRGPLSPTGKWTKDNQVSDDQTSSQAVNAPHSTEQPALAFGQPQLGPIPAFYPPITPGMSQVPHQVSYMPVYNVPTGMPMHGQVAFSSAPVHTPVRENINGTEPKKTFGAGDATQAENEGATRTVMQEQQFDTFRSYMYNPNGQLVMQAPGTIFSMGYMGQPMVPAPGYHGQVVAQNFGITPMVGAVGYTATPVNPPQNTQVNTGTAAPAAPPTKPSNTRASGAPPPSSIRMSEITKKHLENLRASLKKCEDQLQYNRHQIDERQMEQHSQLLRSNIQQFEAKLQIEIAHEKVLYPSTEQGSEAKASARLGRNFGHNMSIPSRQSKADAYRLHVGINSSKTAPSTGPDVWAFLDNPPPPKESSKRYGGLPSTAALAPPFQPRQSANATRQATETPEQKPTYTHLKVDAEPQRVEDSGRAERQVGGHGDFPAPSHHSSSHGYASGVFSEHKGSLEIPYLVGMLPYGADPKTTFGIDYVYNRPLTDDELRARHLYWGQAPASIIKGLPKFDGKDFFAASPQKKSQGGPSPGAMPTAKPEAVYAFKAPQRLTDPFMSVEPDKSVADTGALSARNQEKKHVVIQIVAQGGKQRLSDSEHAPTTANSSSIDLNSSSDDSDGDKFPIWTGRRNMDRSSGSRTTNDFWQSMRKKSTASASVLPGAVTSMTAQGVLPQYSSGYAAASLSPAIAVHPASLAQPSVPKATDSRGYGTGSSFHQENRSENQPPNSSMSSVDESAEPLRRHNHRVGTQHGYATRSCNA